MRQLIHSPARVISIVLLIAWMATIFTFSSRSADLSTEDSIGAGMFIARIIVPDFDSWSAAEQLAFAESIDHPVRKCAHATEYAILGILWLAVLRGSPLPHRKAGAVSWVLAALYACSDELHQLFVPGRSCQITDVMIDSLGAAAGILLVSGLLLLWARNAEKNRSASG